MINFKQQELLEKLVDDIRSQFPEVEYLYTTPSAENPNELWIHVTAPKDEEREFALIEFSSEKTMDILLNYGYPMLVLPLSQMNGSERQSEPSPLGLQGVSS